MPVDPVREDPAGAGPAVLGRVDRAGAGRAVLGPVDPAGVVPADPGLAVGDPVAPDLIRDVGRRGVLTVRTSGDAPTGVIPASAGGRPGTCHRALSPSGSRRSWPG